MEPSQSLSTIVALIFLTGLTRSNQIDLMNSQNEESIAQWDVTDMRKNGETPQELPNLT